MAQSEPQKTQSTDKQPASTLAPEDFYMENGYIVFTEVYHLKRGYCCNSGCRHCPYREDD